MRPMNDILSEYSPDLTAVTGWCDEMYEELFAYHFNVVRSLYDRLNSDSHPITDEELNSILIDLPVELFTASEALNQLKRDVEVIKLKNRDKRVEVKSAIMQDLSNAGSKVIQSELNELVSAKMAEYEVPLIAFSSLVARVESQMSFARELIMGAKKIFDARRSSERTNPISEVVPNDPSDIPEYNREVKKNEYIK